MRVNIFSRLSKREKTIFYIVSVIITALFFDRGVLQPVMNKLNQLNEETLFQEKKLRKFTYTLFQEDSIIREHRKVTQHLEQERSDEKENAELLSEIEKLASKCSVFLSDIKPGSIKPVGKETKPYKRYAVEIQVKTEITYLIDFIYQLEKSQRMLRVKEFHLMSTEKNSPILKGHIVITQLLL